MTNYLVLYRSSITAGEQMAQSTPEQAQAGMDAWTAWAEQAGDAVVDLGTPLEVVENGGDSGDPIGGYSILQAESNEALGKLWRTIRTRRWAAQSRHSNASGYLRDVTASPATLQISQVEHPPHDARPLRDRLGGAVCPPQCASETLASGRIILLVQDGFEGRAGGRPVP